MTLSGGLKETGTTVAAAGVFDAFLTAGVSSGGTDIGGKVFVVASSFDLTSIVTSTADNALYLADEAKAIALVADTDNIASATLFSINYITGDGADGETITTVGTVTVDDLDGLLGSNFGII